MHFQIMMWTHFVTLAVLIGSASLMSIENYSHHPASSSALGSRDQDLTQGILSRQKRTIGPVSFGRVSVIGARLHISAKHLQQNMTQASYLSLQVSKLAMYTDLQDNQNRYIQDFHKAAIFSVSRNFKICHFLYNVTFELLCYRLQILPHPPLGVNNLVRMSLF